MAKLIMTIKPIEAVKEFSSATLANLGEYLFTIIPSASGTKRAEVSSSIISNIGMEKLVLKRTYTRAGKTKGTAIEVDIINPTTIGNLPPTKLTTKGAPNPVDIPVNNSTGNAIAEKIRWENEYISKGRMSNFTIDNSSNIFGLAKVVIRSLASNLRRFRNKSAPRKTKRYGENIWPMYGNKTPLNIERGITIIRITKALLLLLK
jgi:hypothetical protein